MSIEEYLAAAQAYLSRNMKTVKVPSGTEFLIRKPSELEVMSLASQQRKKTAEMQGQDEGTVSREIVRLAVGLCMAEPKMPVEKLIDDDLWALFKAVNEFAGLTTAKGGGGQDATDSFPVGKP